jgi:CRISPR-associated protein Cas6
MSDTTLEMIDAVFEISGGTVPAAYPFVLWAELTRLLPELANHTSIGVLPLRTTPSAHGLLLAKRSKLVIRIPLALADVVLALEGKSCTLGEHDLQIGSSKLREIAPYPTIQSYLVAGNTDEITFMQEISAALEKINLVIHDLKPDDSLRLQYLGLGSSRQYGCGVFVPYKVISDL